MCVRDYDDGLGKMLGHAIIATKLMKNAGEQLRVCESLRLRQLTREHEALFHSLQSLIRTAEKPERPRSKTRHRDAGIQCIQKRIIAMERRVVECECCLVVVQGQLKITKVRIGNFQRPMPTHRQSRIRQSLR